ncbi:glycogen/starch/alpha-glucan phosphorylase [Macrococcus equipercicus]|uniref:Alpha-1,4 glucan phosphorylase n=1 Tax=Macrococcus equipercicus TaxID=69967 RepID=A0ABQ6RBX4_9STAP|nr:glycogen/starch/alpha-glucan phosphorylase [Macrococcus equipercicus]KAA1042737.1 glycogen/starch/alpha-glucan phosphorylase [Macrococcus equipercicus]
MRTYTKYEFLDLLEDKLRKQRMTTVDDATDKDLFYAIAAIINDEVRQAGLETVKRYRQNKERQVSYLSLEFLIGRLIESNLVNTGFKAVCDEVLTDLGRSPRAVYHEEEDAALGNGGLGRLAACFLDSVASLGLAGNGFGIRYRYGLFEQHIAEGHQIELPDNWLKEPYPWETRRAEEAVTVNFGGSVDYITDDDGNYVFTVTNPQKVTAVPYDVSIVGYRNDVVNNLRLFKAEAADHLENATYNSRLDEMNAIDQISAVLYPDDNSEDGKLLRLKQQYFLVSATIQTLVKRFKQTFGVPLTQFHDKNVIQINDTHPTLGIPELMRVLMDEEGLDWDAAWHVTTQTFAYTNHTIMQEALEKWSYDLIRQLNPRVLMIIEEINRRFCEDKPTEDIEEIAIISDGLVHMSRLAIVGSFSVNGVAALHSEIIKNYTFNAFYRLTPDKFNNKTNGITHRRWLQNANPELSRLITERIGDTWVTHPEQLEQLMNYTDDVEFLEQLHAVKFSNKQRLKALIFEQTGITVDENSIFDVQIKRLHEYKRQLLNVFHMMYLYNTIKDNPAINMQPRTFIFGAKAAPGYKRAKEIIRLIHAVADTVNADPAVGSRMKVVFLENYNVSLAEDIIPAADISEQISTASMEASGTGNMKMMMNGAVTLGTMDGANVEIDERVGRDNIIIFGLSSDDVIGYQHNGGYNARDVYTNDDRVKRVMDQLIDDTFNHGKSFDDLYYHLLKDNDPYFVLEDFTAYVEAQERAAALYQDKKTWQRMSLVNIAQSGRFSSDRTIKEYNQDIWKLHNNQ